MSHRLTPLELRTIQGLLDIDRADDATIARTMKCSEVWIRKLRKRNSITGTIVKPGNPYGAVRLTDFHRNVRHSSPGCPPSLTHILIAQALLDHLASKNDLYQDEMQWWLLDNFNLFVSISTISRALKGVKWNKKSMGIIAT